MSKLLELSLHSVSWKYYICTEGSWQLMRVLLCLRDFQFSAMYTVLELTWSKGNLLQSFHMLNLH